MKVDFLTDDFAVSPQIEVADLETLKAQGFNSVFCHRPDQEEDGQPAFAEIAKAAEAAGLEARHLPVVPQHISDEEHAAFQEMLDALPKPVLAYCKSGVRAKMLWDAANS